MTTFHDAEATCPICENDVTIRMLTSTNTFGGRDTDFRSHPVGFDPLYIVVSECPSCGYSDYAQGFTKPRELSDDVKEQIREAIDPPPAEERRRTSRVYATGAEIAKIRGANATEIADWYLKAAWCSEDEGDRDAEINYRRLAIEYFQRGLQDETIEGQAVPNITYLIGELYRRVGDEESAHEWFNTIINMEDPDGQFARLQEVARQQRDDPQQQF